MAGLAVAGLATVMIATVVGVALDPSSLGLRQAPATSEHEPATNGHEDGGGHDHGAPPARVTPDPADDFEAHDATLPPLPEGACTARRS